MRVGCAGSRHRRSDTRGALLRNRQILGLRFRRQHVLHGFIVDFSCLELKLVLEIDGKSHREPTKASYDSARTGWLSSAGYRVI